MYTGGPYCDRLNGKCRTWYHPLSYRWTALEGAIVVHDGSTVTIAAETAFVSNTATFGGE